MRLFLLPFLIGSAFAGASWTFKDGKATVAAKGDSVGSSESFSPTSPLPSALSLGPKDTLKLSLHIQLSVSSTADANHRPHQAFILLSSPSSPNLETFFPLAAKHSGKAKVDIAHKDIPSFLLDEPELQMRLVLGSMGTSTPALVNIGRITPVLDPMARQQNEARKVKELGTGDVKYGKKPEIRHIFKDDPKNPPVLITLVFTALVLASLGGLIVAWFAILGANYNHLPKALKAAPIAHAVFYGGIVALEAVWALYYAKWNLFQTLPTAAAIAVPVVFAGSKALSEVQARRLRGER